MPEYGPMPPPVIYDFPPHVIGSMLLIGLALAIAFIVAIISLPDE